MPPNSSQSPAPLFHFWKWKLHWQVVLGIALGVILGALSGNSVSESAQLSSRVDIQIYSLFGSLFMNALKMLIVPLVMCSIISAMTEMGAQSGFMRMGGKTLLYYSCTSLLAILIGLTLVNLIAPGTGTNLSIEEVTQAVSSEGSLESEKMAFLQEKTAGKDTSSLLNVFYEIIPSNVVWAMSKQDMLGMIFFSLLFGYFISRAQTKAREFLTSLFQSLYEVMIQMTYLVLKFLPLGITFLIAKTAAETFAEGQVLERLSQLSLFAITVLLALGIHAFVVMPLILILLARVSPKKHFKAIGQALLTGFSTASSSATLPLTMECIEEKAGVSKKVTSFVLPVGATVNMDGTALYECVAVLFLAQLSGITLDMSAQFLVVIMALLTSIGVAGIPAASLVAIMIILNAVNGQLGPEQNIPVDALAIILIFDRLLDMCRTATNILGDTVGTVLIAKSEGENEVLS
ncbi:MAG: dicarboxylate/amino acid:cation symporter [Planctomycetes bacterium]|nr:dicarboxylate/amino acid:cation symporter [Planctomycetota bacterium]